jgi:hypothetical protein
MMMVSADAPVKLNKIFHHHQRLKTINHDDFVSVSVHFVLIFKQIKLIKNVGER